MHYHKWFDACKKFGIAVFENEYKKEFAKFCDISEEELSEDLDKSRPKYTPEAFVNALVEFIVSDDLVYYKFNDIWQILLTKCYSSL